MDAREVREGVEGGSWECMDAREVREGVELGVYGCQRSEGGSGGRVKKAENVWILGK